MGQRVDEIRHLTPKDSWRHCPRDVNPTDLPSHGLTTKELSSSNTWWNGPNFLHTHVNQWPEMSQPAQTEEEEIQQEAIKTEKVITHSMVNTETSDSLDHGIEKIMDIERYSNNTTLLQVTGYVIRFVNTVKTRMQKESQGNLSNKLTADELKNSETQWIKSVQANTFVNKLSFLNRKNSKSTHTPPIRVAQFGLFLSEDQTIRCKG